MTLLRKAFVSSVPAFLIDMDARGRFNGMVTSTTALPVRKQSWMMVSIELEFDEARRLYRAALSPGIPLGEHLLELELVGEFKGSASIRTLVERDVFLINTVLGAVGLVVLGFLLCFAVFLIRNYSNVKGLFLDEKARLAGLRKKYRIDFYKRNISEEELNTGVRELDDGVREIKPFLKQHSWFYTGFLKTIPRVRWEKRLPERLQVVVLVKRLAGRKGKFSREEVAMVMREENYSERVVSNVLEELYRKKP